MPMETAYKVLATTLDISFGEKENHKKDCEEKECGS
jgi:hypothetical protein